jgi:hypothetical protein
MKTRNTREQSEVRRCVWKRQWGGCYLFRGYVTARLRVAIGPRISTHTPPSIDITFPLVFPCCVSEQFSMRNGTGKLPNIVHANSDLQSHRATWVQSSWSLCSVFWRFKSPGMLTPWRLVNIYHNVPEDLHFQYCFLDRTSVMTNTDYYQMDVWIFGPYSVLVFLVVFFAVPNAPKRSGFKWPKRSKALLLYSETCLKRNAIVPVLFFRFHRFPFTKGCVLIKQSTKNMIV